MSDYCSIAIGGVALVMYFPQSWEDLISLSAEIKEHGARIIGGGSNIVFADTVSTPLVSLKSLPEVLGFSEDGTVDVSAGMSLSRLVRQSVTQGWLGLDCLAGIPGTVGGAVYMNAGAMGGCIADTLDEVQFFCPEDGSIGWLTRDSLQMGYRSSLFQDGRLVVLTARFKLAKGEVAGLSNGVEEIISRRFSSRIKYPNCGSVFRNPDNTDKTAGELLEAAGMKGMVCGGVRVSREHANYFENFANATYVDFANLLDICYNNVKCKFAVDLKTEVEIID